MPNHYQVLFQSVKLMYLLNKPFTLNIQVLKNHPRYSPLPHQCNTAVMYHALKQPYHKLYKFKMEH